MDERLILIFTRNPELGKVKTRLAASIGNENALEVYRFLLNHTQKTVHDIKASKRVLYADDINQNDIWDNELYEKGTQFGQDLGTRMRNAFAEGFDQEYNKIVIIGTDLFDLEASDIEEAFQQLDYNDVVIGPAEDGGYYLLGLKFIPKGIFINKNWSTNTVLPDTLKDIKNLNCHLLKTKNDIDTIDDIKNIDVFEKYL